MKRSLLPVKILVLVPFLLFCSPKNAQHSGKAEKAGTVGTDTSHTAGEYNQRIIHNSDDQKTVDSLKKARQKPK
ncbi:MAG: hypothetical protein WCI48_09285 [Bacteroidota bacterium]|jgi:hypothetical protein